MSRLLGESIERFLKGAGTAFLIGQPGPEEEKTAEFPGFTKRAREILRLANLEAIRLNHEEVRTIHVLLGLLREGSGLAHAALRDNGLELEAARLIARNLLGARPDMVIMGKLPMAPEVHQLITLAVEEAGKLGHSYIGTEHLLLGLLRLDETSMAIYIIKGFMEPAEIRESVLELIGIERHESKPTGLIFGLKFGPEAQRIPKLQELIVDCLSQHSSLAGVKFTVSKAEPLELPIEIKKA